MIFNVLTRTSSRPRAILNCHHSVVKQRKCIVNHFITYEDDTDLRLIPLSQRLQTYKVQHSSILPLRNEDNRIHAPYNLHCNILLDEVEDGWIMFLDDDDHLLHDQVLYELESIIKKEDEDTLFVFKMRYPDGSVKPPKSIFKERRIKINEIGSCCFLFHSKYRNFARWDEWKGADFRFLKQLEKEIPKIKWINKVFIQINNKGDFGQQNDIKNFYNSIIFEKKWYWFFLPKYHWKLLGYPIFNKTFIHKLKSKFF